MSATQSLASARAEAIEKRVRFFNKLLGDSSAVHKATHQSLVDVASEVVKKHPISSTGAGLALGFALSAFQEPLMKEIEKGIKDVSSELSSTATAFAHQAFSSSLSGVASEIAKQLVKRI